MRTHGNSHVTAKSTHVDDGEVEDEKGRRNFRRAPIFCHEQRTSTLLLPREECSGSARETGEKERGERARTPYSLILLLPLLKPVPDPHTYRAREI